MNLPICCHFRRKKWGKDNWPLKVRVARVEFLVLLTTSGTVGLTKVQIQHVSALFQPWPGPINMAIEPIFCVAVDRKSEHLAIEVKMIRFRCSLVQFASSTHRCNKPGLLKVITVCT